MGIQCPKCGEKLAVDLKESLEPYTMTMVIEPKAGRMVAAETFGGVVTALSNLLKSVGEDVGHTTAVHIHDLSVDADGKVRITVNALPVRKEG